MRVGRPADFTNVRRGKAHVLAGSIGKRRDGARMAEREGHPHVDHVGDREIGFLALLLVEDRMG